MLADILTGLALLATGDAPVMSGEQVRTLIREKQVPLRSLALVLEGTQRPFGDKARLGVDPLNLGEEFQGALLLRGSDGFFDYYVVRPGLPRGVVRQKYANLGGVGAETEQLLDARRPVQAKRARTYAGRTEFRSMVIPLPVSALFATWFLQKRCEMPSNEVIGQGWEVVDGRSCLTVDVHGIQLKDASAAERDRNVQRFWIDMDRGAVTLRMESIQDGKPIARIDQVEVREFPQPDGPSVWVPIHSRLRNYLTPDQRSQTLSEPTLETITATVAGSIRINAPLPDSLFSVETELSRPDSPAPGETRNAEESGGLIRRFRTQPPPPPTTNATDPASVRKRVAAHLEEADRRAEELRASSPARQSWSGTTVAQVAIGVLGVGLLGTVIALRVRGVA